MGNNPHVLFLIRLHERGGAERSENQESRFLKSILNAGETLKLLLLRRTWTSEFLDFELSYGNLGKRVVPEMAVAAYANDELQGSKENLRTPIGGRKSRGVLSAQAVSRCEKQSIGTLSESSGELAK